MSVINQMLRDLDARDASDNERAGLPPRLRPLPPSLQARRQGWRMLAIGVGIGAVVAGGLVALTLAPAPPSAPPASSPPSPQVAPPAAPSPATAAVPPAPTSAAAPAVALDAGEMKLSTLLASGKPPIAPPALPPAKAEAQAAKPTAVKPEDKPADKPAPPPAAKAAGKPTEKSANKPAEKPANLNVPAEPAADARIDKRSKDEGRDLAEAEYRKGMQAVKRGDSAAAAPLFARALEFDPAAHKARQALLSVLVGGKRWAEAQRVAQAGLDLDPTQSGWATIIARLQFEQGDTPGAVQTLERYAVHAPHDADYQGLFAYLLQKQARPAEAAQRFKLALQSRPNEGRWWFGLGLALEQAGQAGESHEAYGKARQAGNLPADMAKVVEQKLKTP